MVVMKLNIVISPGSIHYEYFPLTKLQLCYIQLNLSNAFTLFVF